MGPSPIVMRAVRSSSLLVRAQYKEKRLSPKLSLYAHKIHFIQLINAINPFQLNKIDIVI